MKNSKNMAPKVIIGVVSLIILITLCLSPNLIGKLLGNVNSVNTNFNEEIKTGVVLDTNLILDSNDQVVLKIYNGSKSDIVINSYIWRETCKFECSSETFNVVNLDTPLTVISDSEQQYVISDTNTISSFKNNTVDVGVQYQLEDKLYNIFSFVGDLPEFSPSLNSKSDEQTPEEFIIESKHSDGKDDLYITLSDNNVHMDISENLSDLNLTYKLKSGFSNNWYIESPIRESAFSADMFGEANKSNIKEYLNVSTNSDSISGKGAFDYSNGKQFSLNGKPRQVVTNQIIIPTFYFEQFKYIALGPARQYTYYSSSADDFESKKIPQFSLTAYDKSGLITAANNAIKRIRKYSEESVDFNSWYDYVYLVYNNAFNLYESRDTYKYCVLNYKTLEETCEDREVNQASIDDMIYELNNYNVSLKASADYTKYKELIKLIESKPESWYTKESYDKFKLVYNNKDEYLNINESYQSKLDNYVEKLKTAFDELVMYDADYKAVDAAIASAQSIVNKTDDGKYDKYTKESWDKLQAAINAVDKSLKIEDQDIVDGYASSISEAHAALEIAPAIYENLNKVITEYRNSEGYINNWYTDETKNLVENYIDENIVFDKKITEQSVVDEWAKELGVLVNNLKLKKALGYLKEDNYHPEELPNALSIEEYLNYVLGERDKKYEGNNLYTDETIANVNNLVAIFWDENRNWLFDGRYNNITIDKQSDLDDCIIDLDNKIKTILVKNNGDYTELTKYYAIALGLNQNYYEDVSQLNYIINNTSWNYKIDEQDKIDQQTNNIKSVLSNLVMKDADYEEFNVAYEKALSLIEENYVDFIPVKSAIKKADNVKGLKIDKQSVVDEATDELNNAIDTLVLKEADYSEINILKLYIEQLDESKYINFDVVTNALNEIVYGKKIDEQYIVDQMYVRLKKSFDELMKTKADYTKLNEAVLEAKKYESSKLNYTNYSELEELINSVNYDLTWDHQEEVDGLAKKINSAISNLIKKLADYKDLSLVLSKIPADYSNYESPLKNQITDFLERVKLLPNNLTYDNQDKIDELVKLGNELVAKISLVNKENFTNNDGNITNNNSNVSDEKPDVDIILSYLKVNGNKVNINKFPLKHEVGYDISEAKIEVGLVSSDNTSKVYGGNVLVPGDNNITIIVTTKDGKTYTYNLVITRSTISNYLSNLSIKNAEITFDKTKQEYNIKVGTKVKKLDISALAEDDTAKITIKGNKNIKNGSKVTVTVKSSDGNIRVYTLNVQKPGSVNVSIVIILIMTLIVISGIFKFIQEKKRVN